MVKILHGYLAWDVLMLSEVKVWVDVNGVVQAIHRKRQLEIEGVEQEIGTRPGRMKNMCVLGNVKHVCWAEAK
jgi:hypothetical protein